MKIIRKFLRKTLNSLGYEVQKRGLSDNFKILKKIFDQNNEVNIFDVGANEGRWIEGAINSFNKPTIHAFEPSEKEFNILKEKYSLKKNIILNNYALGSHKEEKYFNINYKGSLSSFYDVYENTNWFKRQQNNKKLFDKNFTLKKEKVNIDTVDNYVNLKNIDSIDILKIDTQGYEPKVLEGALKSLGSKKIKTILLEIIFSDIYKSNVSFFEIEKNLINNGYKLISLDDHGNIFNKTIFQLNAIYMLKS
jgi:FkbM family methyltransferase